MKRFLLFLAVQAVITGIPGWAGEAPDPVEAVQFPIVAWWGIPHSYANESRYQELADAGFTHCLPPDRGLEQNRLHLELAEKAGLKLIVQDRRLVHDAAAVVADYREHPAVAGYHLKDEPSAGEFRDLARTAQIIRALDPDKLTYINLFPTYADEKQLGVPTYEEYLGQYVKILQPTLLSYDNYIIPGNAYREKEFFRNLWMIREMARTIDVPFWAFVMATAHGPYPAPTEGDLRFQAFSSMAYGARGIQYFTYWTPEGRPDHEFREGPVDENGNRTTVYDYARNVNRDIASLGSVLGKLRSTGVYLTAPIPGNPSEPLHDETPPAILQKIGGGAVLLGSFEDPNHLNYLLVVNRSPSDTTKVSLQFVKTVTGISEISRNADNAENLPPLTDRKIVTLELAPGDGRLLRIHKEP